MNRSSIIAILAVLVIACVAGFLFFGGFFGGDVIKVGSSEFKAPEGYHQGAPNKLGDASMSNGTNEIYLTELNGTDVNVHIKGYQDYLKTQNQSIKVSNMNIDNVDIYKSSNDEHPYNVHYWFVKNNHTYNVYKWDGNKNMDKTVIDLVKS